LDWLLRYADGVIAVSNELREQLRAMGVPAGRLRCIHNAVASDEGLETSLSGQFRQAHQIPATAPLVTVVGRITREKGQRVFLEALHRLRRSIPDAHGAVVGEGIDEEGVRAYARGLGLSASVRFAEWQRPIASVYVDSDVMAIPSTAFEGVPNVLLEAMAAGRPVVATKVGGIAEVVTNEEGALLVPPSDPGALAEAIARLLGDKCLRERVVAEGRRLIEANHSPTRRAERIAHLYDTLL
jgi:glycosyltransferase involved in cell wall biosynthesis